MTTGPRKGLSLVCSSVVELETVNFAVAGSNPARPASPYSSAVERFVYTENVGSSILSGGTTHPPTMKKSKLKKLIEKPLRFHHQDLHEEIETLSDLMVVMNNRLIRLEEMIKNAQSADP